MKVKQVLEKVYYSVQSKHNPSKDVKIHKNPNHAELNLLLRKAELNEARGLLDR